MYVMFTMLNTTCVQSMNLFMTVITNLCTKLNVVGALIDNRADAPICVLEDKDRAKKSDLDLALRQFFEGRCHVEHVYKITPCWITFEVSIHLFECY